jgi:TolB-like protein/DNA-binding winged helix-turn-helix (wHTH) protein/tetratricopeptide (TPR) repeat protein
MSTSAKHLYAFESFRLDPQERLLLRDGQPVPLPPRVFDTLVLLVQNSGHLVLKDDLMKTLWPDSFVEEVNLSQNVSMLRKVLGEKPHEQRYITTVPGSGYRFAANVREVVENGKEQNEVVVSSYIHSRVIIEQEEDETAEAALSIPTVNTQLNGSGADATPVRTVRAVIRPLAFVLLAAIVVAAVLLGLNVGAWRDRLLVRDTNRHIQAVAVLPLSNLSADPEQQYFADGMTEALITELGRISTPHVISRQSTVQYKGSKKPLQEIAKELRVDAVLEGAVERSGDRVRVTVRLSQTSPETQLWANEYSGSVRDLLRLEDDIARAVAGEVQVKLKPPEQVHFATARTVDPEAQDAYLRGRFFWNKGTAGSLSGGQTELDLQTAIGDFKRAIEKDPDYALAYAGLADAYIALGNEDGAGHYPKETLPEAKAAATKASELDPYLGEAHFSRAQTIELYDWNWSEAEKEYRRALELNPNDADAHLEYGRFLQALGRNDEATAQMNYAIQLDPLNFKTMEIVGYVTYASGQYDLAIEQFSSLGDDFGLGWAYREKKMYPKAIAALEKSVSRSGRHELPLATLAGVYGLAGRRGEALKLIDELKARARLRYVPSSLFAHAYLGLGERNEALGWIERAYDEHDQGMVYIKAYPGWNTLHSEPRFQALVRRMNFPR